jgi:hypothetical protein
MSVMTEAELAGVWDSFDAEVQRCVNRATDAAGPNAALAEPMNERQGAARNARTMSVSSSANSVVSSLARTAARRRVTGPSRARRRIAQLHAMARDTQPHLRAIERERNAGGKAAGQSHSRVHDSDARVPGVASQKPSVPTVAGSDPPGATAVLPTSPRTNALEDVLYEAYQALLSRPRDFEARTLGVKGPVRGESAPWQTLTLGEGTQATWSDAFTPSQLAAHGFRLDHQRPMQLHCEAEEAQEAVRSISALMHIHRLQTAV